MQARTGPSDTIKPCIRFAKKEFPASLHAPAFDDVTAPRVASVSGAGSARRSAVGACWPCTARDRPGGHRASFWSEGGQRPTATSCFGLGQRVTGHLVLRMPCQGCPDGLCRQEVIPATENAGDARWLTPRRAGLQRVGQRLWRCQDDHRAARPPHPSRPYPRSRQRQPPLQGRLRDSETETAPAIPA